MFGKQLVQIRGITPEKAAVIVDQYPTPARWVGYMYIASVHVCVRARHFRTLDPGLWKSGGPTQNSVGKVGRGGGGGGEAGGESPV